MVYWLDRTPRSFWLRYGIALLAFALALGLRYAVSGLLGKHSPSSIFFLPALLTAIVAGLGPSLLALVLGTVTNIAFIAPRSDEPILGLSLALGINFTVSLVCLFYIHIARVSLIELEREVGERRAAEERERVQAERLRTTLASVADAVVSADAEGLVTGLNPVAEALTGWRASEAVGRPLGVVFREVHAGTLDTAEMPIVEILRDGSVVRGESLTMLVRRDGSTMPVEHSAAPLKDDRGVIGGVVVAFRDVTARREAEMRAAERRRVAEVMSRIGRLLAAELELDKIARLVTRETAVLTRAAYGAFYYDDDREPAPARERDGLKPSLTLYESVGNLPSRFPPTGSIADIDAAFRGERVVRVDDIPESRDPSPKRSWPGGRTAVTRSLLAVPVVSRSGRVFGALVLGHTDPSAFGPTDEQIGEGIAAHAAVAIENARLYRDAQESEERFRQLAENVSDIFWMYEVPSGRQLYVGPAYETIWGRSCQSVYDKPASFLDAIHPDDLPRVLVALARRERGEPTAEEYRIVRPDGSIRWIWDRGFPIKDPSGRIVRFAGIAEDVTERKNAEEVIRESDRRKTEFLAMLAHELRNPLAPVRNALHLIESAAGTDPHAEEHRMIERQVVHMTRLIDDLLDVSRISRGTIDLRRQVVDLRDVIARAVEAARPLAVEARHELSARLPETPMNLSADPTRLEQVFGNLISNAVKYTDPGGTIGVSADFEGPTAVVRVRDNGIGIRREMLGRVFEWFFQGRQRPDLSQGGLGIGLSLAHWLVEYHGGTLTAESDGPGRGSEMIVRLPLLVEPPVTAPTPAGAPPAPAPVDDRPGRHRVLVVDDNLDAATSLVRLLTRVWGQDVRVAHDGLSALEVADEFRPELVLLDIGLPGMNGYEVARSLRGRPEFGATRLVAVTGWGQDEDRRKSHEAGFDLHMVKPIEPRVLGDLVTDLDATPT